ncbi:CPBP family intramembrane metalloprotease [Halorubrum gandharaense]
MTDPSTPRDGETDAAAGDSPDEPADDPGSVSDSTGIAVVAALALSVGGVLVMVLASLGTSLLTAPLPFSPGVQVGVSIAIAQYVGFIGVGLAYLRWRGFDWSGVVSYLGIRRPSLLELGLVIGGWVVIFGSAILISLLVQALGAEPAANQSAEMAFDNPEIIPILILAMFLVVGPAEEVLFRGVVQGRLRESMSAAPAIVIASALFAAIHVIALTGGIEGRLVTVAVLFAPSLVFGAVYEYTGNLVVPALLHGLHNSVLMTLIYIVATFGEDLEEFEELAGEGAATALATLAPLLGF